MKQYEYSTVTTKYQVTIPKKVRKKLSNIKPYSKVSVFERNGEIIIKPRKTIDDVIGILGEPPVSGKGKTFDEIRTEALKNLEKI